MRKILSLSLVICVLYPTKDLKTLDEDKFLKVVKSEGLTLTDFSVNDINLGDINDNYIAEDYDKGYSFNFIYYKSEDIAEEQKETSVDGFKDVYISDYTPKDEKEVGGGNYKIHTIEFDEVFMEARRVQDKVIFIYIFDLSYKDEALEIYNKIVD